MYPSKMPPHFEKMRAEISKRHVRNASITVAIGIALVATALIAAAREQTPSRALQTLPLIVMLIYFFATTKWIAADDERLCTELGYQCPECHKSLFVAGRGPAMPSIKEGLCPHCKTHLK